MAIDRGAADGNGHSPRARAAAASSWGQDGKFDDLVARPQPPRLEFWAYLLLLLAGPLIESACPSPPKIWEVVRWGTRLQCGAVSVRPLLPLPVR
jgi:hypothetical protein